MLLRVDANALGVPERPPHRLIHPLAEETVGVVPCAVVYDHVRVVGLAYHHADHDRLVLVQHGRLCTFHDDMSIH